MPALLFIRTIISLLVFILRQIKVHFFEIKTTVCVVKGCLGFMTNWSPRGEAAWGGEGRLAPPLQAHLDLVHACTWEIQGKRQRYTQKPLAYVMLK